MTRALLPPLRTRRLGRGAIFPRPAAGLTPGARRTVAAIGALLVAFSVSAQAAERPAAPSGAGASVS